MSNFKQIHGDNIIPFRLLGQSRPLPRQKPGKKLKQTPYPKRTTSQPSPTPEQNKEYVRLLASKGNPTQELVDECAPAIVRRVLRCVRKRSRPDNQLPRTLPKVLSRQLQLLCDFDHPAGITLRDWLNGKLHALPDGFEETYARSSNREELGHD
ncbi:MAG: hypothetical protein ABJO86_03735 [Lentilitoribacter sp.]